MKIFRNKILSVFRSMTISVFLPFDIDNIATKQQKGHLIEIEIEVKTKFTQDFWNQFKKASLKKKTAVKMCKGKTIR